MTDKTEFNPRKFAVIGAGPVGCIVAAFLASGGHEVTLCDVVPELLEPAIDRGILSIAYHEIVIAVTVSNAVFPILPIGIVKTGHCPASGILITRYILCGHNGPALVSLINQNIAIAYYLNNKGQVTAAC